MTVETLDPQQLDELGEGQGLVDGDAELDVGGVAGTVEVEVAAGGAGGRVAGFGRAEEGVVQAVWERSAEGVKGLGGCDFDDRSASDFFVCVHSACI